MVLCPYVFLLTSHIPPLRLQPSEVASTHWVPIRALLSPEQRTYWRQNISTRSTRNVFGLKGWFDRLAGDMLFAAVRLQPSESNYCTSIPEYMKDEMPVIEDESLNISAPLSQTMLRKTLRWTGEPLLLWGLTLGVMGDFLDLFPLESPLRVWVYPTFTALDVRFILWLMSYRYRRNTQQHLEDKYQAAGVPARSGHSMLPSPLVSYDGQVDGASDLDQGRWYGRLTVDKRGSRNDAIGQLLKGYFDQVKQAVIVSMIGRLLLILTLSWIGTRKLGTKFRKMW